MPGGAFAADAEGDGEDRGRVVAVPASFSSTCFQLLRDVAREAASNVASRSREFYVADVAGEVTTLGSQIMGYVERELMELPIVQRFENEPLSSLFPLLAVGIMMGFVGMPFTFFYMPAMHISPLSWPSVVFHASFCLALGAYHQGCLTHPGTIPSNWKGSPGGKPQFALKGNKTFEPLERKKTTNGYRYCKNEGKFKPDRAHFCRVMNQNVLRMDHYCPWLANCVGHRNYKYFLLILFYDSLCTNLANFKLCMALHVGGHSAMHTFMFSQGIMVSSVASLVVTPFFIFHCWLLSKNKTTIEFCEAGRRGEQGENPEEGSPSPYDLGLWHNVSSALGQEWYFWWLPVKPTLGDGLNWQVAPEFEDKKRLPPSLVSTVVTARTASEAKGEKEEEPEPEEEEEVAEEPPALDVQASGSQSVAAPRRKCSAARGQHMAHTARVACAQATSLASSAAQEVADCAARLPPMPPMPRFVRGGMEAMQECGNDLFSFSAEKATYLWSWYSPPPAPRMTSTVTEREQLL